MKNRRLVLAGIPSVIALLPVAVMADGIVQTNKMLLTLVLKGNDQDMLWISFGTVSPQLMSATVTIVFLVGLVWFINRR